MAPRVSSPPASSSGGPAPVAARGQATPAPAVRPAPRLTSLVAAAMIGVTGLLVAFGGYLLLGSRLEAERQQDVLYSRLVEDLAAAVVPVNGAIPTGTPLGILSIPALGVEQVFVEGSASEQTAIGPGLRHDSVLPGQAGLSVLVGRRATFGAPFADLDRLQPGDELVVTTGQGEATYVVDLVRTSDAPTSEIAQVPARLTLITSDPALAPNRQLVVSAALDGEPLPRGTGTATVADDAPGEGSSGHLVALLLWSQAFLLVVLGLTWGAARLPSAALWIGGAPVAVAVTWNVCQQLAYLLPNTL